MGNFNFKEILNNITDSVVITDLDGNIEYVNDTVLNITGYDREYLIGKNAKIFKSGHTASHIYEDMWKTISSGNRWNGRFHNKKKNGTFYTEQATIFPILNTENKLKYIGIKKDITEMLKNVEYLDAKNKFIDKLTYTIPNIIYLYDLNSCKNLYYNYAVFDVCGYTPNELKQMGNEIIESVIHPNDIQYIKKYYDDIKKKTNGKVYEIEYRFKHKDGHYIWLLSRDSIFEIDEYGIPSVVLGTAIDITDRKEQENKLQDEIYTKNKLFSIISHDLKGPLHGILGYTEFLYESIDKLRPDEIKDFTKNLYSLSKDMNVLIYNLLNWSRLQSKNIIFDPIKINLNDFVEYVFDLLKLNSDLKNILLHNYTDKEITVYADEKMLLSILQNLINNSIKFTNDGGNVKVYSVQEKNNERISIIIEDDGIGMKPENLNRLYSLKDKYINKGTNSESGTGLGLIIVKEFVEHHSGTLIIDSSVGNGTSVKFDLEICND